MWKAKSMIAQSSIEKNCACKWTSSVFSYLWFRYWEWVHTNSVQYSDLEVSIP